MSRASFLVAILTFRFVMVGAADSGPVTIISATQPQTTPSLPTTVETDGKTVTITRLGAQSQATALAIVNSTSTLSLQTDSDGKNTTVLVTSVGSLVSSGSQAVSSVPKASESVTSNATASESSSSAPSGSNTSAAMNSKPILRVVLLVAVPIIMFSSPS
ncbi:hypothetical protein PM082_012569 [Marasmius tenuissimus]|nr:hypothetical protein PM082_012569 [Marasmius tenuissimus]